MLCFPRRILGAALSALCPPSALNGACAHGEPQLSDVKNPFG
jgi:hypothetical protein